MQVQNRIIVEFTFKKKRNLAIYESRESSVGSKYGCYYRHKKKGSRYTDKKNKTRSESTD